MCGRMVLATPVAELGRLFGFPERPNLAPRYNLAPTQTVALVRRDEAGGRSLALVRWGLVPSWADDPAIGARLINARAETVASKPAFRAAFRQRRGLVLADGFYEWRAGAGPRKQPYLIRRRDAAPFAFAGLWERWPGPKTAGTPPPQPLVSATVITTTANAAVAPLHDRMPVILDQAGQAAWLDPDTPPQDAQALLRPCPDDWLEFRPVDTRVNNARYDAPDCIAPLPEQPTLL